MPKPARFLFNLFLSIALLAASFFPARAASPIIPLAGTPAAPIEPPPQRTSLMPDRPPHSKLLAGSQAAPDQSTLAWQVPIPDTCVALSELDITALEFDLYVYTPQAAQYLRLSNTPEDEIEAHFNHGCTRILYTRVPPSPAKEDLYLVNPDGSGQLRLTQNQGNNYDGAWSRDGSKIAFTSDRDGQPEVYVMNADGSNQVRLTINRAKDHDYDGMPDWSPDGTKIAFVSNRSGKYTIWVMNADGSNLSDYTWEPYSFHPHWALDGKSILYDAAVNVNGTAFQRLYQEFFNGSVYHSSQIDVGVSSVATVDVNAGGWSPEGGYYYYSLVTWNYNNQAWYWVDASAYLKQVSTSGSGSLLSPGTTDWYPSWETYDNQIPDFKFDALPAISPSHFTLSWSAQDISHYNMIYCIDSEEKDNDWWGPSCSSATSEISGGYGGHTYKYRGYARDGFLNESTWTEAPMVFTTIENLPPKTHLLPLPALNPGPVIELNWTGDDPGGSGIRDYDVQYQDTTSATGWTDLLTATTATSYAFSGTFGHTYVFRVRGTDNAVNVESWANSAPPVSTTSYASRVTGGLHDSSGNPIPGVTPVVDAPFYLNPPTLVDGSFASYFLTVPLGLSLSWNKAGYGTQPPSYLDLSTNPNVNIYLPPADDVVANGGFESGSLGPSDWTPSGEISPVIVADPAHTGHAAARLGSPAGFEDSALVGPTSAKMVVDSSGLVHSISAGASDQYYYSKRGTDGSWSAKQALPGVQSSIDRILAFDVDASLTVSVIFTTGLQLILLQLPPNGSWSAPNVLTTEGFYDEAAVMDTNGRLHVAFAQHVDQSHMAISSVQFDHGTWLPIQTIAILPLLNLWGQKMVSGPDGEVSLLISAREYQTDDSQLWFSQRTGDGTWSPVELIAEADQNQYQFFTIIAISPSGNTSLLWLTNIKGTYGYSILYTEKMADGHWSAPVKVDTTPTCAIETPLIAIGPDGTVIVGYKYYVDNSGTAKTQDGYYLVERSPAGTWSEPVKVPGTSHYSIANGLASGALTIDINSRVHFIWTEHALMYFSMNEDWTFARSLEVSDGPILRGLSQLVLGADQSVNVLWFTEITYPTDSKTYYFTRLQTVQQPSDSQISQTVQVPPLANHPGLSFLYQFQSNALSQDDLSVEIAGSDTPTHLFTAGQNTSGWTHVWIDLAPWAGQSVTLVFKIHDNPGFESAIAYLDEISVGSTSPDTWLQSNFAAHAVPGGQVTIPITFGNRGKVPGDGSHITLTLPAGVTFVSASVAPSAISPDLTWDVGDLSPESGPTVIWVTLHLDPSLPSFTTFTYSASLSVSSTELEITNNTSSGSFITSLAIYLPLLMK